MKLKPIIISTLAVAAVATAGIFGVHAVSAATNGVYSTLVQRIADKFHLNPNDVQGVVDQVHSEDQVQMQQKFADRLTELVNNKTITQAQKDAILSKTAEEKKKLDDLRSKNLSRDEMKTEMQKIRDDLQAWAKANGIDEKYLVLRMMGGPGHGRFH